MVSDFYIYSLLEIYHKQISMSIDIDLFYI